MHQLVELERGHGADEQSKYDDEQHSSKHDPGPTSPALPYTSRRR
jgi:hypothetical protein